MEERKVMRRRGNIMNKNDLKVLNKKISKVSKKDFNLFNTIE